MIPQMPSVIEEFDPAEYYKAPEPTQRAFAPAAGTREAATRIVKTVLLSGIGAVMIWFGLTSTVSYFAQASRFSGWLGTVFYGFQAGTLIAMVGAILIYDSLKRSGYL